MILRARIVVTMDGAPIENGAVAVERDKIVDVGGFDEVKARNSGEIVDLGEQALLPGLINAHCHLDYTCLRGKIPRQKTFADWIRAIIAAKEKLTPQDYLASINDGFAEARKFGATTIANLTAFPDLTLQIQPPIRTWWFAELIDMRSPQGAGELVDSAVASLGSTPNWGLAPHSPFSASANLYQRCEEIARSKNVLLTTHLAESLDEMEMFRSQRGPLFDFLSGLGRDNSDLHGATPVTHACQVCEFDDRWLLVHVNEIVMDDLERLLRPKKPPHIVQCPRSREYFGHSPFKYGKFQKLGFNVCLGTDSLASNDDLSLFAEMRALQRRRPKVPPKEILEMVTTNPARALHQENALGKIRAGFQADLIAIPFSTPKTIFDEIISFSEAVPWLMVGGRSQ